MVPVNGRRTVARRTRPMPIGFFLIVLLTLCGCAATLDQKPVAMRPAETKTAARLEAARRDPDALRDFFRRMPKGGDLHIHTSGAAYPEDLLRMAAGKGLCVNPVSGVLSLPPCGPATTGHTLSVAQVVGDEDLKDRLTDLWSVRNSPSESRAANNHFFAIFGRIGLATEEVPTILADLRDRAARDNIQYLEVMFRIRDVDRKAVALGRQVGWDEDLKNLRGRLLAAGLKELVTEAGAGIDRTHEESLGRLRCGTADAQPGCGVAIRYQQYANRTLPKEAVFAQFVLAFEVVRMHPLVCGVNIVGQENDPTALADYALHMKMVGALHRLYPEVRIALHAGELTPELAPQEALRFHIREALRTGQANRIGHAADIRHEEAFGETLQEMADRRIAVEVMPTSSRYVLSLDGQAHPFPLYQERGVPVVLATDNPGILLTDLAEEFTVMALRYPYLRWQDFKTFARNSLEFSFLIGKGLWHKPGDYREKTDACRGVEPGETPPSLACLDHLGENPKAALQWALEERLAVFEAAGNAPEEGTAGGKR
jgi:adenosine deaminase